MKDEKRNRWKQACAVYVVGCAFIDLFPHFGTPFFRYTGSDPAAHVWNLGWPLPLFIFDSKSGLHIGPFVFPVVGVQLVLFGLGTAFYLMKKRRQNQEIHGTR